LNETALFGNRLRCHSVVNPAHEAANPKQVDAAGPQRHASDRMTNTVWCKNRAQETSMHYPLFLLRRDRGAPLDDSSDPAAAWLATQR
jgi:hypothetical protein